MKESIAIQSGGIVDPDDKQPFTYASELPDTSKVPHVGKIEIRGINDVSQVQWSAIPGTPNFRPLAEKQPELGLI